MFVSHGIKSIFFYLRDFQTVDIPLNHEALFMRPVLFASLALAYLFWLERRVYK